ncbi:hypothetical protein M885DRAFT_469180 [Pelagophyceae sp. CCMP2097]|nr:hypothetical protein M885DRAFT_469180 [Pelagophyceae sp. CCMP2097]
MDGAAIERRPRRVLARRHRGRAPSESRRRVGVGRGKSAGGRGCGPTSGRRLLAADGRTPPGAAEGAQPRAGGPQGRPRRAARGGGPAHQRPSSGPINTPACCVSARGARGEQPSEHARAAARRGTRRRRPLGTPTPQTPWYSESEARPPSPVVLPPAIWSGGPTRLGLL